MVHLKCNVSAFIGIWCTYNVDRQCTWRCTYIYTVSAPNGAVCTYILHCQCTQWNSVHVHCTAPVHSQGHGACAVFTISALKGALCSCIVRCRWAHCYIMNGHSQGIWQVNQHWHSVFNVYCKYTQWRSWFTCGLPHMCNMCSISAKLLTEVHFAPELNCVTHFRCRGHWHFLKYERSRCTATTVRSQSWKNMSHPYLVHFTSSKDSYYCYMSLKHITTRKM